MRAASDLHRCSLIRRVAMETCVTRFGASIPEASEDTLVSLRMTLDDTNLDDGSKTLQDASCTAETTCSLLEGPETARAFFGALPPDDDFRANLSSSFLYGS